MTRSVPIFVFFIILNTIDSQIPPKGKKMPRNQETATSNSKYPEFKLPDSKCPEVPKSELASIIKFLAYLSKTDQDKASFDSLINLLKFILAKEVDDSKKSKFNLLKISSPSLDRSQNATLNKTTALNKAKSSYIPKSLIPIFKPKQKLTSKLMPNILSQELIVETPKPQRPKSKKKKTKRQKNRTKTKTKENIANGNENNDPPANHNTFTIPCQRASDILQEAFKEQPREQSQPVYQDLNYDFIGNLNQAEPRKTLNPKSEAQIYSNYNQIVSKPINSSPLKEDVVVHLKPQKVSLMQCYGDFMKEVTMSVLLPYCASKSI